VRFLKKDISQEGAKYAIIGSLGYVVDVGLFNVLSIVRSTGNFDMDPIAIKALTTVIAISFTYIGNSRWTFRYRDKRPDSFMRMQKYAVVNVLGILITLLPMYVSRNLLGYDSLLADNISANVIGVGLAAVFRFLASRAWVFEKIR